jgi:hypothetical protein
LNLDGYSKINIPNKTLYLRQHNFCYFPPFVGSAVRIIAEEILSCTHKKLFLSSFHCVGESPLGSLAAVDVKEKYHIFFSIRLHFEKRGLCGGARSARSLAYSIASVQWRVALALACLVTTREKTHRARSQRLQRSTLCKQQSSALQPVA